MINFTVGPVQSGNEILKIGSEQVPYFRTSEFSSVMIENEKLIKKFVNANDDSKVVFITGSGTASMEAAIINTLDENDNVLIINGGSFGKRFTEICDVHSIKYTEIKINRGEQITEEILNDYNNKDYTAFLVNVHETSTGVHYDMNIISDFCKKNNLFLIVDAISSFLADEFYMNDYGANVVITGSQKALACPPGVSIIVLSREAQERIEKSKIKSYYLDLKSALSNATRGQTPFTPAVGILLQINARLKQIEKNGGVSVEIERVQKLARDFRKKIEELPFEIVSSDLSNAVTPLHPKNASAYDIFLVLKDEYNIWICPNGGDLKDEVFRVGHIGFLTIEDNDKLISALKDMQKRNLI